MAQSNELQGASVWKGAEMRQSRRWIKEIPAAVLRQIDVAVVMRGARCRGPKTIDDTDVRYRCADDPHGLCIVHGSTAA